MEVRQEQICLTKVIAFEGETVVQTQTSAAEGRVLFCSAEAVVNRCEAQENEIIASGVIKCSAMLEGEEIFTVACSELFELRIPTQGVRLGSAACVASVQCSPRKENGLLLFSCRVKVEGQCYEPAESVIIAELTGEGLQTAEKQVSCGAVAGVYRMRSVLRESLSLSVRMPEVKGALQASSCVSINEARVQDGEIMVDGELLLNMLYDCRDADEPLSQIADKIPFSRVLDASGVREGDEIMVMCAVEEGSIIPRPDDNGEMRIISCEAQLLFTCIVTRKTEFCAITDAYSTGQLLTREYRNLECCTVRGDTRRQSVRINVQKPSDMPSMARISAINVIPGVDNISDDGILNCTADIQVVYIAVGSGELQNFTVRESFNVVCDWDGVISAASICTELMQAVLTGSSSAEIRLVLRATLLSGGCENLRVLATVTEGQARTPSAGICIYIMQQGDTLFSVGDQLGISADDLLVMNPGLGENPPAGTRLTVFCRLRA